MKKLVLVTILFATTIVAKAQLIFRNSGPDTLRIAVGIFYDTSKKVIMAAGPLSKPVVVRGWYKLYPGDSLSLGKFIGPAIYYARQTIRNNKYIIGDTIGVKGSYAEEFYTVHPPSPGDTSKFSIIHPVKSDAARRFVVDYFRAYIIPVEAKKSGRLIVELGNRW